MFKRIASNMVICEGCKKHLHDRIIHVVLTSFVFVCAQKCPTHVVLCFCFVINRLMYPMLPNSLVCLFLIIPSVLYNVYFVWILLYCVVLCISLFGHQFIYYCIVCPSSKYDYFCFFIPVLREFTTGFNLSWNFSIISFLRSL